MFVELGALDSGVDNPEDPTEFEATEIGREGGGEQLFHWAPPSASRSWTARDLAILRETACRW